MSIQQQRFPIENEAERRKYLLDLEATLTGTDIQDPALPSTPMSVRGFDPKARESGLDWPTTALTMVGTRRLRNFRRVIEYAITGGIPGDIIETGVWRGGASILARAVLAAHGVRDRKVIVADSFEGLPPPNATAWPADHGSRLHEYSDLAVPLEQVQANFRKFGLLDEQVVFLKGWFRDTMPTVPSEQLAVIRLDGDMYESTIDPLTHLYDRLSPGGWVIVDDYWAVEACRLAVHDFFAQRGIEPKLRQIDAIGVYFRK